MWHPKSSESTILGSAARRRGSDLVCLDSSRNGEVKWMTNIGTQNSVFFNRFCYVAMSMVSSELEFLKSLLVNPSLWNFFKFRR